MCHWSAQCKILTFVTPCIIVILHWNSFDSKREFECSKNIAVTPLKTKIWLIYKNHHPKHLVSFKMGKFPVWFLYWKTYVLLKQLIEILWSSIDSMYSLLLLNSSKNSNESKLKRIFLFIKTCNCSLWRFINEQTLWLSGQHMLKYQQKIYLKSRRPSRTQITEMKLEVFPKFFFAWQAQTVFQFNFRLAGYKWCEPEDFGSMQVSHITLCKQWKAKCKIGRASCR